MSDIALSKSKSQPWGSEPIDLGIGRPDFRLLPLAELQQAAAHRCSLADTTCLQYASEASGSPSLRGHLADFLIRHYGSVVRPERLFITAGASHGLDLISGRFAQPGDTVFVEAPTYFLALKLFQARNLRIVSVPTDAEGVDVVALEHLLEVEKPAFLYTIPIHHNPTSVTLSVARRRKLVELAEKHEFFIVADEVYQLLNYEGETPIPFAALDNSRVFSLGSFSKILGPGLRLGWIETEPEHFSILSQCGVIQSGGGINPFTSAIVESAITLGLQDAYLARIREVYRHRCAHMIQVLDDVLPRTVSFTKPKGGFFLWLKLPQSINSNDLLTEAHAFKIGFRPGTLFSPEKDFTNFLRISFTYYNETELEWGCKQLGHLLASHLR
ncbi:MAG: PLP-dependent aminotransferase family protein [Rhizonema sp. PD37]|nr:PLP-dependent aminotransferase family protein [Rhizonema sp. PD37]